MVESGTTSETTDILARFESLSGLPRAELADLAARAQQRQVSRGELIVRKDDPADAFYLVTEGRVRVFLTGPSGREITLGVLGPCSFFGEVALLDGEGRSASVAAIEQARLLVISRADFLDHIRAYPETAMALLTETGRRLRRADAIIGNLALLDVYGRVARLLGEFARTEGVHTEEGVAIHQRHTQQDLAAMLGTTRETVSRVLNDLARRGHITFDRRRIVLRPEFFEGESPS